MFSFIKNKLQKVYQSFTTKINVLFGRTTIDEATLKELEILLIGADTGVKTTTLIIEQLRNAVQTRNDGNNLHDLLEPILFNILQQPSVITENKIHLLVGINGSGKTTFASKLAAFYLDQKKKVLLVAADTFRAAAQEQLNSWAHNIGVDIILGAPNQDPASVVFTGCEQFKKNHYDILIIDTAGRLQTKINLMHELSKIKRTISKQLPNEPIQTLLTIDSMLGQNSFEQAKLFKEATDVSGVVLTKMDGTGKGGIVFSIAHELNIPIQYITFGEQTHDLRPFNSRTYVQELLSK